MQNEHDRFLTEGILFDFDGTLFDTIPLIVESYQYVYRKFKLREHSAEEIKRGIGLPLEEIFAEYPELAAELLREYIDFNRIRTATHVGLYIEAGRMLDTLREAGIPLGIVSAKRWDSIKPTLDMFDMEHYFQAIVTKGDTDKHKPDPEPLFLGMQKMGFKDPSRVIYAGDSVHDLRAAHNGGFMAAAVAWSAMPREDLEAENPDLWIENGEQLLRSILLKDAKNEEL